MTDDPVSSLKLVDSFGKLNFDADGYEKYYPSESEKALIEKRLGDQIEQCIKDYAPYFEKVRDNIATYEALPQSGEVLTVPIAKRDANQIIAWALATILRPRPLISVDPYFPATYTTLAQVQPDEEMMAMGVMQPVPTEVPYDSEEIAQALELDAEYTFRERIPLAEILETVITDCVVGASPAWVKVCYERRERDVRFNKYSKTAEGFVRLSGKEEKVLATEEPVKIIPLSVFNVLKPADCDDDSGPIFERQSMGDVEFREKLSSGEYDLVDESEYEDLMKKVTRIQIAAKDSIRSQIDKRSAESPQDKHDVWECWFEWPVRVEEANELGEVTKRFKMLQLCAHYHLTARKLLMAYRHPYDHGMPIYVPFFQRKKTHRFAGGSTVEDVATHQKLISQMLFLDIKGAVHANNFVYWSTDDEATRTLTQADVKNGIVVPAKFNEDWGAAPLGASHNGLGQQIGFLNQDAALTTGVSEMEHGGGPINRTAASTIAQVMQAGLAQPLQFLRSLNHGMAKVIRLYYETRRQFQPFGSTAPFRDPESQQLTEIPVRYPVEALLDGFRFTLTAIDEEQAKEAEFEQLTMQLGILQQIGSAVAQVTGPMANLAMPPAQTALLADIAKGFLEMGKLIFEKTRRDPNKFVPSKKLVDAILQEKQMVLQQQQMQAAMGMGGMGAGTADQVAPGEPQAAPSGDGFPVQ
jgi:hypothetical protein